MKILILTERFFPEEFLINDLAAEWRSAGHDVEVLTQVPSYPGDRIFSGYRNRLFQTAENAAAPSCQSTSQFCVAIIIAQKNAGSYRFHGMSPRAPWRRFPTRFSSPYLSPRYLSRNSGLIPPASRIDMSRTLQSR